MDPLTLFYLGRDPEALTRNRQLVETLLAQARRERAEAMHRLIVESIKSLFTRSHALRKRNPVRHAVG